MTKENRFEGLMGVVGKNKKERTSGRSDAQRSDSKKSPDSSENVETSKHSNIQTSTPKEDNSNPNISTSEYSDVQMFKCLN